MNIQRKNSAHHFRMQSERKQTLVLYMHFPPLVGNGMCITILIERNKSKKFFF